MINDVIKHYTTPTYSEHKYIGGHQSQFVYICHTMTASNIRYIRRVASLSDIVIIVCSAATHLQLY